MAEKFYITTPLYYVNAAPHIGHSYTNIAADVISRYMRSTCGDANIWFLTGTDEHGQKIQRAAEELKLSPQEFSDKMVAKFTELWKELNISYNDFIRTTQPRHITTVQRVLEILYQKGDIYKDRYEGLYCTPCETFWLPAQAPDNLCPDCRRPLEQISEINFFLNLEKYQSWLIRHINENPLFLLPVIRRNEVLRFLELNKLEPLCISRPKERLNWGITLPFSPEHVTYVWFDALINYISAVGEFDSHNVYKSKWWPADLHLIGKDILRQHAVYWPIMLRALNIEPPKTVFAHGWWLISDTKMSKSRGNVVNPLDMVSKFGIDVYRYFLLRDAPFGGDGNFSEEAIIKRFNGDLANDLGNLVYRTLTMAEKYFDGRIYSEVSMPASDQAKAIALKIQNLNAQIADNLSASGGINFSLALENIWELVKMANKYVEDTKPWNLSKEGKSEDLKAFIRLLVEVIRKVADALCPFMPNTAELIKKQLGSQKVNKGLPLFPRYVN